MDSKEGAVKMREHYNKRGDEYICGKGSLLDNTAEIREFIEKIIKEYNIKSINDAACGSFNWMSEVNLTGVKYVGFDIDSGLLDKNRERYPEVGFRNFDIVGQILPRADLIICRDVLFHLLDIDVITVINNFRKSKSRFLLATTHVSPKNIDITQSGHKMYSKNYGFTEKRNLFLPPFNMEECIDYVREEQFDRLCALWRL